MTSLPNSWAVANVGSVAMFLRGVTYKKPQARAEPGPGYLPLLRATNINSERLVLDDDLIYVPEELVKDEQRLRLGDVVVATSSGSISVVGKSALMTQEWEGTFGAFCGVIRSGPELSPRYLAHFVHHAQVRRAWSSAAQGTSINNLKPRDIEQTPVPLPPREEQRRIVDAIEEQFSRLEAAEESMSRAAGRLRSLHQALLANLVGLGNWSREPLVDICARIVDCEHSTAKFRPTGVACVDTTNIEPGRIMVSRLRYVSEDTYQQRVRRMKPQAGDVLFAREGTVGTAVLVPENLRLCLGQRVMALRPSDRVLPKFLELTLNSPVVRRQYEAKILGTTAPHLNVADIRRLQVPLPSLLEQGQIVQEAERQMTMLDALADGVALTVRRAKSLRRATLHEAFAGRLTPGYRAGLA